MSKFEFEVLSNEDLSKRILQNERVNMLEMLATHEVQVRGFMQELTKASADTKMGKDEKAKKLQDLKDEIEKVSGRLKAFRETLATIEELEKDVTKVWK